MKQDGQNKISGPITGLNLKGITVIIRRGNLAHEYQGGDRRFLCADGSGCYPDARGKAVFGIFRGEENVRFDRLDIEGVAAHQLRAKA